MENLFLEIPDDKLSNQYPPAAAAEMPGEDIFDTSYLLGLAKNTAARQDSEKYVLFKLDGSHYAIELKNVVEVCRQLPITPLPNVPGWLAGVVNLRGDLLSVINTRAFDPAAVPAIDPRSKIVVIADRAAGISVGLLVDQILEIVALPREKMEPAASDGGSINAFTAARIDRNGLSIMVLNIKKLLSSPLLKI